MRVDQLLYRLRFLKSRSLAQKLVETGHVRCNGSRVSRTSHPVAEGDVLTFPIGKGVRVIEVASLPQRRGPAAEAQRCYRMLDGFGQSALAAGEGSASKGISPQ